MIKYYFDHTQKNVLTDKINSKIDKKVSKKIRSNFFLVIIIIFVDDFNDSKHAYKKGKK